MPLTPIKMLVQIHIVRFQLFLAHEAIKKLLNANFFCCNIYHRNSLKMTDKLTISLIPPKKWEKCAYFILHPLK